MNLTAGKRTLWTNTGQERHWSIPSGETHMDQSLVHTFSWGNSYGPMVLKVLQSFPLHWHWSMDGYSQDWSSDGRNSEVRASERRDSEGRQNHALRLCGRVSTVLFGKNAFPSFYRAISSWGKHGTLCTYETSIFGVFLDVTK